MKLKVNMQITEGFLPNRRCRKIRHRYTDREIEVEIAEPDKKEFPTAFIVHKYDGDITLRAYDGKLWKAVRNSDWRAVNDFEDDWTDIRKVAYFLSRSRNYSDDSSQFTENSIIVEDNLDAVTKQVKEKAKEYIVYNNKLWKPHGEPRYVVMTFGLGHNHGGTALMLDYRYNSNISHERYFNALQRDEAIQSAKDVAKRRGDTESIDHIGKSYNIQVIDERMVRCLPAADHGAGDEFMNALENLTEICSSSSEAGLLAVALTANEIIKGE